MMHFRNAEAREPGVSRCIDEEIFFNNKMVTNIHNKLEALVAVPKNRSTEE